MCGVHHTFPALLCAPDGERSTRERGRRGVHEVQGDVQAGLFVVAERLGEEDRQVREGGRAAADGHTRGRPSRGRPARRRGVGGERGRAGLRLCRHEHQGRVKRRAWVRVERPRGRTGRRPQERARGARLHSPRRMLAAAARAGRRPGRVRPRPGWSEPWRYSRGRRLRASRPGFLHTVLRRAHSRPDRGRGRPGCCVRRRCPRRRRAVDRRPDCPRSVLPRCCGGPGAPR